VNRLAYSSWEEKMFQHNVSRKKKSCDLYQLIVHTIRKNLTSTGFSYQINLK
jgi:hypothetical protein